MQRASPPCWQALLASYILNVWRAVGQPNALIGGMIDFGPASPYPYDLRETPFFLLIAVSPHAPPITPHFPLPVSTPRLPSPSLAFGQVCGTRLDEALLIWLPSLVASLGFTLGSYAYLVALLRSSVHRMHACTRAHPQVYGMRMACMHQVELTDSMHPLAGCVRCGGPRAPDGVGGTIGHAVGMPYTCHTLPYTCHTHDRPRGGGLLPPSLSFSALLCPSLPFSALL